MQSPDNADTVAVCVVPPPADAVPYSLVVNGYNGGVVMARPVAREVRANGTSQLIADDGEVLLSAAHVLTVRPGGRIDAWVSHPYPGDTHHTLCDEDINAVSEFAEQLWDNIAKDDATCTTPEGGVPVYINDRLVERLRAPVAPSSTVLALFGPNGLLALRDSCGPNQGAMMYSTVNNHWRVVLYREIYVPYAPNTPESRLNMDIVYLAEQAAIKAINGFLAGRTSTGDDDDVE